MLKGGEHRRPDLGNNAGLYRGGKGIFDDENAYLASLWGKGPEAIKLYPNPATSELTIEYTMPGKLELVDMLGRVTLTVALPEGGQKATIDISRQAPGTYGYKYLVNGVEQQHGKLVIIP